MRCVICGQMFCPEKEVEWPAMREKILPFGSFQSLRTIRLVLAYFVKCYGWLNNLSNGLP